MPDESHVQAIPPEQDVPDRRALELASICDLVESGAATTVSVTFTRSGDGADIGTLAQQITAGRGLVASIEAGPDTVTVHIRGPEGFTRE